MLELAKDFTALMIIAQIDNWFAVMSKELIIKDIFDSPDEYDDLFKIETTTSNDTLKPEDNQPMEHDPAYDFFLKNKDDLRNSKN